MPQLLRNCRSCIADLMKYPDGSPHTSHSDSEVPFCLIHPKLKDVSLYVDEKQKYALKDVAPTIIKALALPKPKSFTGNSIFN